MIKNIFINLTASSWHILLNILFVPVYIRLLGIEAYGIIGFYLGLQVVVSTFDFGLGSTALRKITQYRINGLQTDINDFLKTVEVVIFIISGCLLVLIVVLKNYLFVDWFNTDSYSSNDINNILTIMSISVITQLPINFYRNVFMGFEEHMSFNSIDCIINLLRHVTAVLLLLNIAASLTVFFAVQLCINVVLIVVLLLVSHRKANFTSSKSNFSFSQLNEIKNFAAGISIIGFLSIIIGQVDKFMLSKLLSLEEFGKYALASLVATSLTKLFTPIFNTAYPRLSTLFHEGDQNGLIASYHKFSLILSAVIVPVFITIIIFSKQVFVVWTNDIMLSESTHLLLSIMCIGTLLNGLVNIPYAMQLAGGWTKLNIILNLMSAVLIGPLLYLLVSYFGAPGGASAWMIINIMFFIIMPWFTHVRFMSKEFTNWLFLDVLSVISICLVTSIVCKLFLGFIDHDRQTLLLLLALNYLCSIMLTIGFTPLRHDLKDFMLTRNFKI